MNILVDIRCLLDKPYTGVAEYTLNFLNSLFKKDSRNHYFLFYNSWHQQNKDLPKFDWPKVKVIDFHWPNKFFNFCLKFFSWPKIDKLVEKRIRQKIDEVILPNFNFVAFSKKAKITLVVHDLSFEIYHEFFTFKQRFWHKLVNPKKICQNASKIITHSENTKNDLINLYKISEEKIEIRKPSLREKFKKLEKKDPQLLRIKEKYHLPGKFILYLGNLDRRKNIDTLIHAFHTCLIAKLFNCYLVVAGQGRERKKIEKLVKDLKLEEKIKFIGYVAEEDKCALYNLAQVFVYLSFYEGFGYPVAEALTCGTPVITGHTSSLIEIQGENIIFINPYNLNDLIQAIKEIFTNHTS